MPVINADEIARTLERADPQAAAAEARVMASQQVLEHLQARTPFGIESTLNGTMDLSLVHRAKELVYETEAVLVWSGSVEVSVDRVRLRVELNGHSVPMDEIRTRYESAMEALPIIIGAVDLATVIDNSRPQADGPEIVLQAENGVVVQLATPSPKWLALSFERWRAPLALQEDLTELAREPRTYQAARLLTTKRSRAE